MLASTTGLKGCAKSGAVNMGAKQSFCTVKQLLTPRRPNKQRGTEGLNNPVRGVTTLAKFFTETTVITADAWFLAQENQGLPTLWLIEGALDPDKPVCL